MPTVQLHDIALLKCIWNIANLNVVVNKSNLTFMELNLEGNPHWKSRNEVDINSSLPVIVLLNSTIKEFNGHFIHLKMIDSVIDVNTQDIGPPFFMMGSSFAEIYNCSFYGAKMTGKDPNQSNDVTSLIFHASNRSRVVIKECSFENIQVDMTYDLSAVLYAEISLVEIHNSSFINNTAQWSVIMGATSNVTIVDSIFIHNTADQGGALNIQVNSHLDVHNATFSQNEANNGGSILVAGQSSMYVKDSQFLNNTATHAGAMAIIFSSTGNITSCFFGGNFAPHNGGAVFVQMNSSVSVTDSVFKENRAEMGGGALVVMYTAVVKVTSSRFKGNSAPQGGSLDIQRSSTAILKDTSFAENKAGRNGGAVAIALSSTGKVMTCFFSRNSAGKDAGALSVQTSSSLSIFDSTFSKNHAQQGGAVFVMKNATLKIQKSSFVANKARSYGAVIACGTNANTSILDCRFAQNTAYDASVLYAADNVHLMIDRCRLSQNIASEGSNLVIHNSQINIFDTSFQHHNSTMVYMESSELFIGACYFVNNSLMDATLIEVVGGKGHLSIENTNFTHNQISAIVMAGSSYVSIQNSRFAYNTVRGYGMINSYHMLLNEIKMYNNSVLSGGGIVYSNAIIKCSMFMYNTVDSTYGLIIASGNLNAALQIEQSAFLYNQGNVIVVQKRVDIVLNACNFTGNNGEDGTLSIQGDDAPLRTSNTTIIAPTEGNKVAIHFLLSDKGIKMTDYLTHRTRFLSENASLDSSTTDNFLQEAVDAGLVVIEQQAEPYTVTQEETVFASCKFRYFLLECKSSISRA